MKTIEGGFVSHGQIVWSEGGKSVTVARAIEVSLPGFETASAQYCEQLETAQRTIIRMLPPDMLLQVIWMQNLDHEPLLREFYHDTEQHSANAWARRERNAVFVEQMEREQNGGIRGERLVLVLRLPFAGGARALSNQALEESRKGFDLWIGQIKEAIVRLGGIAAELGEGSLYELIRKYADPAIKSNPVEVDMLDESAPRSLSSILPGDMVGEEGLGFYCGGHYHGFVVLSGLSQATCSGIIAHLLDLASRNYGITLNLKPLDPAREIEHAESKKTKLERAHRSGKNTRLEHAIEALRCQIRALASGEAYPVMVQLIVHAHDASSSEVRARLIAIRSAMTRLQGASGYEVALATTARNLFLAGMPGAPIIENALWHKVNDPVAANLTPMAGEGGRSLRHAQALFQTAKDGLLGIRIFGGARGHGFPRHAFVTGMTGSGKSALLIALLTQTDPFFDFTVIIDEGLSYAVLTWVLTGGTIKPSILSIDGGATLNYWDTAGSPSGSRHLSDTVAVLHLMAGHKSDEDANRLREAVLGRCARRFRNHWAGLWMEADSKRKHSVFRLHLALDSFPENENESRDLVEKHARLLEWAKDHPAEADSLFNPKEMTRPQGSGQEDTLASLAFSKMSPEEMPTHSDFHRWLQKEAESEGRDQGELRILATLLESWRADNGIKGGLLDGVNTVDLSASYVHLELGKLGEADESLKAIVSHVISSKIRDEVTRRPRSQRKRVVIEELGSFLKLRGGERIVRDFYERMRKHSAWVVSVIQQVSSLPESLASSIIGNTRTAFIFRQKEDRDLEALRHSFHLPDSAVEAIRNFPEPSVENGASFLCWEDAGKSNRISVGVNRATPEMLYISNSSGEQFEQRAAALKTYDDVLEGVIAESRKTS